MIVSSLYYSLVVICFIVVISPLLSYHQISVSLLIVFLYYLCWISDNVIHRCYTSGVISFISREKRPHFT